MASHDAERSTQSSELNEDLEAYRDPAEATIALEEQFTRIIFGMPLDPESAEAHEERVVETMARLKAEDDYKNRPLSVIFQQLLDTAGLEEVSKSVAKDRDVLLDEVSTCMLVRASEQPTEIEDVDASLWETALKIAVIRGGAKLRLSQVCWNQGQLDATDRSVVDYLHTVKMTFEELIKQLEEPLSEEAAALAEKDGCYMAYANAAILERELVAKAKELQ